MTEYTNHAEQTGPRLELLPAVDVRDGQAVRLVQGESGSETGYGDPLDAARAVRTDRGPTAIVVANDQMALGLMAGLESAGLEVPGERRIVVAGQQAVMSHAATVRGQKPRLDDYRQSSGE